MRAPLNAKTHYPLGEGDDVLVYLRDRTMRTSCRLNLGWFFLRTHVAGTMLRPIVRTLPPRSTQFTTGRTVYTTNFI